MTVPLQGNTGSSITASASGEGGWELAPQSTKGPSPMDGKQSRGEVLAAFCSPTHHSENNMACPRLLWGRKTATRLYQDDLQGPLLPSPPSTAQWPSGYSWREQVLTNQQCQGADKDCNSRHPSLWDTSTPPPLVQTHQEEGQEPLSSVTISLPHQCNACIVK